VVLFLSRRHFSSGEPDIQSTLGLNPGLFYFPHEGGIPSFSLLSRGGAEPVGAPPEGGRGMKMETFFCPYNARVSGEHGRSPACEAEGAEGTGVTFAVRHTSSDPPEQKA
jgi:hypothetical protein